MKFTYTLTMDDMVAYNLHVYGRTLARRNMWGGIFGSLLVAGLLGFIFRFEPPPAPLFAAGVGGLSFLGIVTVVRARAIAQNVRRMFGSKPDPTTFGMHLVALDHDGVTIELTSVHARYDWEIVGDVVETPAHIFVHLGPVRAIVIPLNETLVGAHREDILHAFRTLRRSPAAD